MMDVPTPHKTQPERHGTMRLSSDPTEPSSDPSEASEVSELEEPWPEPSSDNIAAISLTKSHNELVDRANLRENKVKELKRTVKSANKKEKKLLRKIRKHALALQKREEELQKKEEELKDVRSTNWKLIEQIPTHQTNDAMSKTLTPPDNLEDTTSAGGQSHRGFKHRSTSTGPTSYKSSSHDRPSKRPKHRVRRRPLYSDEAIPDHEQRKPFDRQDASPVQSSDGNANLRMLAPDGDDEGNLEETRSTVHDDGYIQPDDYDGDDDVDGEDQTNQREPEDGLSSQQESDDPVSGDEEENIEDEADKRPCERVDIYFEDTDVAEECVDAALAVLGPHMVATSIALEAAMDKRVSKSNSNMTEDDMHGWDYFCQKTTKCAMSFVRSATTISARSDPEHTTCKYCFNQRLLCLRWSQENSEFYVCRLPSKARQDQSITDVGFYVYQGKEKSQQIEKQVGALWM